MVVKRKIVCSNGSFFFCIPITIFKNFFKNYNYLYYCVRDDVIYFSPRFSIEMRKRRAFNKYWKNYISLPRGFVRKFKLTKDNYVIWKEEDNSFVGEVFQKHENNFYVKVFTIKLFI